MTNVTLATVELRGVEDGTTNLSVEGIDRINDDQGDTITPDTDDGTLTVHKVFPIVGIELPTDPDDDGHYENITSHRNTTTKAWS